MTYDPDGDPNAFDLTDIDAAMAYLDHPVVKALHEDLGRMFRSLPAAEQIEKLNPELQKAEARYAELATGLASTSADDPRQVLLIAAGEYETMIRARIAELREQPQALCKRASVEYRLVQRHQFSDAATSTPAAITPLDLA